jgi:cob(I)alamin adenosyltransferase
VQAYGTVDEANSTVGLARLHAAGEIDAQLAMIQNDLFDLGADLCRPEMEKDAEAAYPPLRMVESQVDAARGRDRRDERAAHSPCGPSSCRAARRSPRISTSAAPSRAGPSG